MNDGTRKGLRIAAAAVLAIALLLVIAVAWVGHGVSASRAGAEARAAAFCDPIAIGADIVSVASSPYVRRMPADTARRATEYRYRFFGGPYDEATCRVSVDGAGRVVAKRVDPAELSPREAASGVGAAASAAASR